MGLLRGVSRLCDRSETKGDPVDCLGKRCQRKSISGCIPTRLQRATVLHTAHREEFSVKIETIKLLSGYSQLVGYDLVMTLNAVLGLPARFIREHRSMIVLGFANVVHCVGAVRPPHMARVIPQRLRCKYFG